MACGNGWVDDVIAMFLDHISFFTALPKKNEELRPRRTTMKREMSDNQS